MTLQNLLDLHETALNYGTKAVNAGDVDTAIKFLTDAQHIMSQIDTMRNGTPTVLELLLDLKTEMRVAASCDGVSHIQIIELTTALDNIITLERSK